MTFVLGAWSTRSIWLLTDRRLSVDNTVRRDDAHKLLRLDAVDGDALLGYAGLGMTARGTEPSNWMSNVLRGRSGLSVDAALGVVAEAAKRELVPVLRRGGVSAHHIVAIAMVRHRPVLFSIDIIMRPHGRYWFGYRRHVSVRRDNGEPTRMPTTRLFVIGSGQRALQRKMVKVASRDIVKVIQAYDRGRVKGETVARLLARVNHDVRIALANLGDQSVGPRTIVAWKSKSEGGRACYTDTTLESSMDAVPWISHGRDLKASSEALWPIALEAMERFKATGSFDLDADALTKAFEHLPSDPDERLR